MDEMAKRPITLVKEVRTLKGHIYVPKVLSY
jgi:hypothetical protein